MEIRECPEHGQEVHHEYADGRFKCKRCVAERVKRRSRSMRSQLVDERGGRCEVCGYDKIKAILQFHHIDPRTKEFGVGSGTRGIARQREEAKKCMLLCPNCHAEKHVVQDADVVLMATRALGTGENQDRNLALAPWD